jgi:outer membrane protein TolC
VRRAVAENLALATERYNRDAAREAVIVADAGFDPVLGASARKFRSEEQSPATTVSATSTDIERVSLSASQKIATGATVTVSGNNQRRETNAFTRFDPQYDSDVSLRVVQPLLSGGGRTANLTAINRATIGVDRSDVTFRARALDVVQGTELVFYDLVFAMRSLEVQKTGLVAAERFLEENEARFRAGLATELDVMQARVGVSTRRSLLLSAEQRVQDAADRLLAALGRTEFAGTPEPQGVVLDGVESADVATSFARAIEQDPEISSARMLLKQLELDVKLAHNQRLPRADLGGTLGYLGREDDFNSSSDLLLERDSYNWQVDLTVSVPWGMRENKSRLRTARLSYDQQAARIRQLEQDLLVRVRAAVRAVETDVDSVAIAALSTELTAREYQLEKAKFDAGLSTSRLVVEAQQREDEARVRETQSRVQLKQNVARLRRVEAGALELYGIQLFEE